MFTKFLTLVRGLVLLSLTFLAYTGCAPAPIEKLVEPTTLRIGWQTAPVNLHPYFGLRDIATEQIYSDTAWVRYRDGTRFDRAPDIAESIEILDGGKTCIIRLLPNLTFHDGKKVTPADLKFSLLHYENLENKGDIRTFFFSGITITEIDSNTVKLESKYVQDWGTFYTTPILEKDYEKRFAGNLKDYVPMGTGPYKFVSYDKEAKVMKLEAFENFAGPKPTIPKLEIHYFDSSEAATIAMLQEKVDYLIDVPAGEMFSLKRKNNIEFFKAAYHYRWGLMINTKCPPFADPKVRRGISMLIDKNKLVDDPDGMNGDALATDAPLHFAYPFTQPVANRFNPASAYKILEEADWKFTKGKLMKNGEQLKLTIMFSDHIQFVLPTLRILARNLEAGGLSISLHQIGWEIFNDLVFKKHDFSVAFTEISDNYELQTNGHFFRVGEPLNFTRISNKRLDELFTSLSHNAPPTLEVKKEIQQIIVEQAPEIPLFYEQAYFALGSRFSSHFKNIQKDPWHLYYLGRPGDRAPLN